MKANEANKKSTEIIQAHVNTQYSEIMADIEVVAAKGEFFIIWADPLHWINKKRLVEDGYTITTEHKHNGTYIKIDWSLQPKKNDNGKD